MSAVRAIGKRKSNAELVVDLAALGHLRTDWLTLDCTFGKGRWWKQWAPDPGMFLASDLHTGMDGEAAHAAAHAGERIVQRWDFTNLPLGDRSIDVVVFDGPYKLNGTPSQGGPATSDADYGVAEPTTFADRMELLRLGAVECARVADKRLIVKCQDQVVSGRKVWQTRDLADVVEPLSRWRLADMLHVQGYRAQPARTRKCEACDGTGDETMDSMLAVGVPGGQYPIGPCPAGCDKGRVPSPQQHAAADYSTCLVFVPR